MLDIPHPPLPQLSDPVAFAVAGGCLAVGVLILLWGRHLGRAYLCLAGVVMGLMLAGPIAQRFELNLTLVRVAGAVVLALVGLILARLIWAALVAVLFAVPAEYIALARCFAEVAEDKRVLFGPADATFTGWMIELCKFFPGGFWWLWQNNLGILMAVVCPAILFPFVIALIRDRLGRILMTSLLGGTMIVLAPVLAASQLRPSIWGGAWTHWYAPLGPAAVLMVVGLVLQYRRAIRDDKMNKDREAEPRDTSELEPDRWATKKK